MSGMQARLDTALPDVRQLGDLRDSHIASVPERQEKLFLWSEAPYGSAQFVIDEQTIGAIVSV